MQGTVTKLGVSKNLKPILYIDGKLYFAGKCDISELAVGDLISFEGHAFSEDGKLWGLDKWGKLPKPTQFAGNGTQGGPGTRPTTPSGSLDEPVLRFISNCVGNAISAGMCTAPDQIEKWVSAARNAITAQTKGDNDEQF
jgi:hypothetical protein